MPGPSIRTWGGERESERKREKGGGGGWVREKLL